MTRIPDIHRQPIRPPKTGLSKNLWTSLSKNLWTSLSWAPFSASSAVLLAIGFVGYVAQFGGECLAQARMALPGPAPYNHAATIDLNGVLEDFDGVLPSLKIVDDSALAGVKRHTRTDQAPFRGRRSERLHFWGKRGGERILVAQSMTPVTLISELEVSSWVRGNRPGFQIMLRVRLPRVLDDSGSPRSLYLLGDRYQTPGHWQQLRVANVDEQFAQRVRAMRVEVQQPVDAGEAYVDQVVFNVFGGAEENEFWVDDLAVLAGIPAPTPQPGSGKSPRVSSSPDAESKQQVPCIVVYHGQPLADVARQGFNGVYFADQATPHQVAEARKQRLQVFHSVHSANPPFSATPHARPSFVPASFETSPETANRTRKVTTASWDDDGDTPLDLAHWCDLSDDGFDRWLPVRTRIRQAIFAGAQGFIFDPVKFSHDVAYRNAVAELVNLEIALFQPWVLRAEAIDRTTGHGSETSYPFMAMSSRHAALVWIPYKNVEATREGWGLSKRGIQPAVDVWDAGNRQAYFLSADALSPARSRRIPGGHRVFLDRVYPSGVLLLTNQSSVLQAYSAQLSGTRDRYQELLLRIIRSELIRLDQRLSEDLPDANHVAHLRTELHALHSRIAPILESSSVQPNCQQLDHFLRQLERVQQVFHDYSE